VLRHNVAGVGGGRGGLTAWLRSAGLCPGAFRAGPPATLVPGHIRSIRKRPEKKELLLRELLEKQSRSVRTLRIVSGPGRQLQDVARKTRQPNLRKHKNNLKKIRIKKLT